MTDENYLDRMVQSLRVYYLRCVHQAFRAGALQAPVRNQVHDSCRQHHGFNCCVVGC